MPGRSIALARSESKVWFLHSESEGDKFTELGASVGDYPIKVLKLATEKCEIYRELNLFLTREMITIQCIQLVELHPQKADPALKIFNLHVLKLRLNPSHKKTEKQTDNPKPVGGIAVRGFRLPIHPKHVPDSVAVRISNISAETTDKEIPTICTSLRPLVGLVRGFRLPIHPKHVPDSVAVRISNISAETTDKEIPTICTSLRPLVGLVRTKDDAVDALFSMKINLDPQSILQESLIYPTFSLLIDINHGHGVDCDEHKRLCSQYGVAGYPTIQWFPNGSLGPKKNQCKMASVPSSVVMLTPDNFDEVVLDETKDVLVEFYAPCGANLLDLHHFFVTLAKLPELYNISTKFGFSPQTYEKVAAAFKSEQDVVWCEWLSHTEILPQEQQRLVKSMMLGEILMTL
ncbi:hypothetical protein RJ641_030815 [Dillenia turbinata]|uniref:Thioredoxin domain-containing protein n=1 Tax=Dillenia turbinata TaxID=194707 RepID=A0AAN8ZGY4_9MAGN